MSVGIKPDLRCASPGEDLASCGEDRLCDGVAQALRAALHVAAAGRKITALRRGEMDPPQGCRIVVIMGQVGGNGPLRCLVAAEGPLQHTVQRLLPVAHHRAELEKRGDAAERVTECIAATAERAEAGGDVLHVVEQRRDRRAHVREAIGQRPARLREGIGKPEGRPKRPAAHFVKRADRRPHEGVEHAEA